MKHLIAIPLQNGYLCRHFGHCEQFSFIQVENDTITGEERITPPPHEPGLLPSWLAEMGVTDVIAGGMGQKAISLLEEQNIRVNVGVDKKSPSTLVSEWLNNELVSGNNACDH